LVCNWRTKLHAIGADLSHSYLQELAV
jgi:hypothetical protein